MREKHDTVVLLGTWRIQSAMNCSMWKDEAKCPECEKLLEEQKEEEVDGID